MGNFRPAKTKCWIKYLKSLGYEFDRVNGSHFQYVKRGMRTIPVREKEKMVPAFHIHKSCQTLGVSKQDVYDWIDKNC